MAVTTLGGNSGCSRINPLFKMAVVQGIRTAIEMHLRRGVDVNARDERGATPLMLAAAKGNAAICRLLLDAGADPSLTDPEGRDACFYASLSRKADVYILLAEATRPVAPIESLPVPLPAGTEPSTEKHQNEITADEAAPTSEVPSQDFGWEIEPEPERPGQDESAVRTANVLSMTLSLHQADADGADWSQIDVELPAVRVERKEGKPEVILDERLRHRLERLILEGLRAGRVHRAEIKKILMRHGSVDAEILETAATTAIGDLGIVIDDEDRAPARIVAHTPLTFLEKDNIEEAVGFIALATAEEDELGRFRHDAARWSLLTKEDEVVYGRQIQDGLNDALAIIARSQTLVGQVLMTGEAIMSGSLPVSVMIGSSSSTTSECADFVFGEDAASDENEPAAEEGMLEFEPSPGFASCFREIEGIHAGMVTAGGPAVDPVLARAMAKALRRMDLSPAFVESLMVSKAENSMETRLLEEFRRAVKRLRQARDRMVMSNVKLVIWVARKYRNRGLDLSDLVQEGIIGLMRASEKFDPSRGFKFATYAIWWIRQGITRAIAEQARLIRLPVHAFEKYVKLKRLMRSGVDPDQLTPDKIASELDADTKTARRLLQALDDVVSLETVDIGVAEAYWAAGRSDEHDEAVLRKELRKALTGALASIDLRTVRVLRLRFGLFDDHDHTLEEVGQLYGVTRERIRQIEAKGLRNLSHPSRAKLLKGFI
jgi:RNA polymerase primary sigma factor